MNSLLIKESTWAHKERSKNRCSITKAEFSLSSVGKLPYYTVHVFKSVKDKRQEKDKKDIHT
jgi:hypothetical protein